MDNLDRRVATFRCNVFADTTKRTYCSYLRCYVAFCAQQHLPLVPISPKDLGRFIAYLSFRVSFLSMRQYLSAVRWLHLEAGFDNPLTSFYIKSVIKGAQRVMGISTHPKLPITPHILDGIHKSLDFTKSIDVTFWAVCLVAFFSFLRKSNLLAQSWEKFHPQKQLARQNISFTADGAIISVTLSKTIQFGQRKLSIPLPHIPKSKFCPSCALLLVFKTNPCSFDPCPAFLYHDINGVHLFFIS